MKDCSFCEPDPDRVFASGEFAFAIWDSYPVSPGHALIVPRRHVPHGWHGLRPAESDQIFELIDTVIVALQVKYEMNGYNLGMNTGEAAGQTIDHTHLHIIPRYTGDCEDPRGGVRHCIPGSGKGYYQRDK